MKKLLRMFALAAMLFASCSKDNIATSPEVNDTSNLITVGVQLPADMIATRSSDIAIPENHDFRCVMAIYENAGAQIGDQVGENYYAVASDGAFSFAVEIEDTGYYTALFWADYSNNEGEDTYYNTADLKAVTSMGAPLTPEYKEAFYVSKSFIKEAAALEIDATLSRAVAKVSIVEKIADSYAYLSTFSASYDVANTFNVATGTTSGEATTTYTNATAEGTEVSTGTTLFYDFLLVDSDDTMGEIAMSFICNDDAKILNDITIPAGIPVKQNQQTTASGTIITVGDAPSASLSVDVSVNAIWGSNVSSTIEFIVDYSSISEVNELLGSSYETLHLSNCYMIDPIVSNGCIVPIGSRINTYWSDSEYGYDETYLIGSDWTSNSTYTVTPLWNDFGLEDYTDQITLSKVKGTDDDYAIKIKFADDFSYEGNMVVAVKKDDTIVWSWHIWITDYNPYTQQNGTTYTIDGYGTWLDRNVGANDIYYHSSGQGTLYYQWGRKDPQRAGATSVKSSVATIADAVKAPEHFYNGYTTGTHYDWCGGSTSYEQDRDHHWRDPKLASMQSGTKYDTAKSIYDPSPLGYMVPGSVSTTTWKSPFEFINSTNYSYIDNCIASIYGITIPMFGQIYDKNGGLFSSPAGYWTASSYSNTHAYYMEFKSSSLSTSNSHGRSTGCPVRSIKE